MGKMVHITIFKFVNIVDTQKLHGLSIHVTPHIGDSNYHITCDDQCRP